MSAAKQLVTSSSPGSFAAPALTGSSERDLIELAEKSSQKDAVAAMKNQMKASVQQIGSSDSLRHSILSLVVEESYDRAISELEIYIDSKPEYPQFKDRAHRYISHSIELIQAVRAKRNFPGWNALNMSKQRDLFEKALEHFENLKMTLTKIEVIEKEVRIEDVRSTVWVIQAFVLCSFALMLFVFAREFWRTMLPTSGALMDGSINSLVNLICDKLGL